MSDPPEIAPEAPPIPPNPYVGPRAFKEGERLFGRKRESGELLDILISQRIVLLYSPSGAGKSSLVEAVLRPALGRNGFHVWPTIRLNLPSQPDDAPTDRFILSTQRSLAGKAGEATIAPSKPAQTIADLLTSLAHPAKEGREHTPDVLIIDQLEEVLTNEASTERGLAARAAWFSQLGAALQDRSRWALFCLREDYLAGLDPFLDAIPTRLRVRYRLDLLQTAGAAEAIRGPAEAVGVDYEKDPDAATQLINNLASISVYRDGAWQQDEGRYVEPVQLQVVCQEMWEHLDWPALPRVDDRIIIGASEIGERTQHVDEALSQYYDRTIATIAAGEQRTVSLPLAAGGQEIVATERRLREWIDTYLITEQNIRRPVQEGSPEANELTAPVMNVFETAHLIRGDYRQSGRWYELAHDRLITPVRTSNTDWYTLHLQPFQQQARLWNQRDRDKTLVLSSAALAAAESWLTTNASPLHSYEEDFLAESRSREEERVKERIKAEQVRTRLQRRAWVAFGCALIALLTAGFATVNWLDSIRMANSTTAMHLTDGSQLALAGGNTELATLYASEAMVFDQHSTKEFTHDVVAAIWGATSDTLPGFALENGHANRIWSVVMTKDSRFLVSGGEDGAVLIQHAEDGEIVAERTRLRGAVRSLALDPTETQIAAGLCENVKTDGGCGASRILVWNFDNGTLSQLRELNGYSSGVRAVAFDPTLPNILVAGGNNGVITVWNTLDQTLISSIRTPGLGGITALAFSPDGHWLSVGICKKRSDLNTCVDKEGAVLMYDARDVTLGTEPNLLPDAPTNGIGAIAFSPNGDTIVVGGGDKTVRLWQRNPLSQLPVLDSIPPSSNAWSLPSSLVGSHEDAVTAVAFDPSGKIVISSGWDKSLRMWNIEGEHRLVGKMTTEVLFAMEFNPTGEFLVGGSNAGLLQYWSAANMDQAIGNVLASGSGLIWDVAMVGSHSLLRANGTESGSQGSVTLWDLSAQPPVSHELISSDTSTTVWSVGASKDGRCAAAGDNMGYIHIWNMATGSELPTPSSLSASPVRALEYSEDGAFLIAGHWNGIVERVDVDCTNESTPATVRQIMSDDEFAHGNVRSLAISPDGKLVAVGGCVDRAVEIGVCSVGGFLGVWDSEAERTVSLCCNRLNAQDVPYTIAFSQDGNFLAAGTLSGRILVWCNVPDLMSSQSLFIAPPDTWWQHAKSVRGLVFAQDPDQTHFSLFSTSDDGTALWWDLTGWTCGNQIKAPVRIWPPDKGTAVIRGASLSSDGKNLYLAFGTGEIRRLILDSDNLRATVCQRVRRHLTHTEWTGYVESSEYGGFASWFGARPDDRDPCSTSSAEVVLVERAPTNPAAPP